MQMNLLGSAIGAWRRDALLHGHPLRDGGDRILAGGAPFEELTCRARHEGGGDGLRPGHAALPERGSQAGLEIGDAVALKRAEAWRLTILREAYELHGTPPGGKMWEGLYSLTRTYAARAAAP